MRKRGSVRQTREILRVRTVFGGGQSGEGNVGLDSVSSLPVPIQSSHSFISSRAASQEQREQQVGGEGDALRVGRCEDKSRARAQVPTSEGVAGTTGRPGISFHRAI
jgi:hypothetical protein